MRDINRIIIHYSYTPPSMNVGVNTIREWHTNQPPKGRGWRDVGYHFIIRRDGSVEKGRDVSDVGAHTRGHNNDSIGIVMVGGKKEGEEESEVNFTCAQWRALGVLVKDLKLQYETITDVSGHKDNTETECPGFNVKAWAETI